MAEKNTNANKMIPEFLREPIVAAQARLTELEGEAQKRLKGLVKKGKEGQKEVAAVMKRLTKQDWKMEDLRDRVTKLRDQGTERAQELRGKAENLRAEALEKLGDLQVKVALSLGFATRDQVEELSKELARLTRRMDKYEKPRKNTEQAAEV